MPAPRKIPRGSCGSVGSENDCESRWSMVRTSVKGKPLSMDQIACRTEELTRHRIDFRANYECHAASGTYTVREISRRIPVVVPPEEPLIPDNPDNLPPILRCRSSGQFHSLSHSPPAAKEPAGHGLINNDNPRFFVVVVLGEVSALDKGCLQRLEISGTDRVIGWCPELR